MPRSSWKRTILDTIKRVQNADGTVSIERLEEELPRILKEIPANPKDPLYFLNRHLVEMCRLGIIMEIRPGLYGLLKKAIPIATDEERRTYKRLIASLWDLDQAIDAARQILKRDLHSSNDPDDRALLKCLNTCLIIACIRPFSGNWDAPDVSKDLPPKILGGLSAKQRQLFDSLKKIRDQDQAHSDGIVQDIKVRVSQVGALKFVTPSSRNTLHPLSRSATEEAEGLAVTLTGLLCVEKQRLEGKFQDGEEF